MFFIDISPILRYNKVTKSKGNNKMSDKKYTIGLDFGSLSCRGVLVNVKDGSLAAEASMAYPHAVLSETLPDGTPLQGDFCLQSPADFRESMISVVRELAAKCDPSDVIGIAIDTTASTVLPIDKDFIPLCEKEAFASRPHAWMKMWKHHGAAPQAEKILRVCREQKKPYPDWYGGTVSPECLLSKVVEVFERDREVYDEAAAFLEVMDYLTSLLTGTPTFSLPLMKAKAFYDNGYPDKEFLSAIHQDLAELPNKLTDGFAEKVIAFPGERAGSLCPEMAEILGLDEGIAVSVGTADSYSPISALGITREGIMIMIIGTSMGMMLMSREGHSVSGVTASLPDIYRKDLWGYASGLTSVGDSFGWFAENCVPARYEKEASERRISIQQLLTEKASILEPGAGGVMALDWLKGNKSCLANPYLSGLFIGITISTRPEQMYRALIEATAFGARRVIEEYRASGVPIDEIRACGGIVGKNPLLMQIYADVIGLPIKASWCAQAPALGSAINAASAAGIRNAIDSMSDGNFKIYYPKEDNIARYDALYAEYLTLHDYFGRGGNRIMERLRGKM